MSQHPETNFRGSLPFPIDSQPFPVNPVQCHQNVYGFPPPAIPPVSPISLSVPPPPLPLPFISSASPWNPFVQQPLQHCIVPQNNQHFNFAPNDQITPVISENVSEDQNWVKSWLKDIGKLPVVVGKRNTTTDLKIYETKELLATAINIIKELENASVTLNVMMKSVPNKEWENKCQEIEEKKEELSQLLHVLKLDPVIMTEVRKKLKKRKAKRDRLKRQSLKRKAEKKECEENKKKLHRQIDLWLAEMKESVERNRREEELKSEADSILWEVTQKKNEAKRQISLLTALLQLRGAKAKTLKSSGNYVPDSDVTTFNFVIENLKTLWEQQLNGYLIEEQGLRGMLTENVEIKDSCGKHVKQTLIEWETAIFGSKYDDTTGEPWDLEEFVHVRRTWDHFLANDETVMASTIPVGWVLPTKPSDPNWAKSLKHMK